MSKSLASRGYELCRCMSCYCVMWSMPAPTTPSGVVLDFRMCTACSGQDKDRTNRSNAHRREKVLDDIDGDFDMFDKTTHIREHLQDCAKN